MIYIDRPLELLVDTNRPLTKQKGVQKLYLERKDIYESAKDIKVSNDSSVENAKKEIIEKYEIACNQRG